MHLHRTIYRRRFLSVLLALTLVAAPAIADEGSTTADTAKRVGKVTFDVVVLRPLMSTQLILGAVIFPAAALVSWPGGAVDEALDMFVLTPYEYAITRDLGDF